MANEDEGFIFREFYYDRIETMKTSDDPTEKKEKQSSQLMELFNVPSGAYDSPDAIDLFIREERNAWD